MEIIIGKTAGFCFGVANAVNKTTKLLDENDSLSCLGELVHNKQVTNELQDKGLNIIEDVSDAKKNVIIRSHGVPKQVYEKGKELGLNIIDLTCPKVLKIHNIAEEYSQKGYYILLIGKSNHPEIIGTISYCGKNSDIIEDETQVEEKLKTFYNSDIKKLLVVAQTTFSLDKFNKIVSIIEENIKEHENIELEIKRTICDATRLRQEETKDIASKVDMMIIIGGKHSSNTNKLYEVSRKYCNNCILIETKEEINLNEIAKYQRIGVMAGTSTPKKSIDAVVEMINELC